jgi:hypothetical protein
VAVLPTGAALILDQLAERVVGVADEGSPVPVAQVPIDAMDLVAGPDGAFAAYSKVRAQAWLHAPSGSPLGAMEVPRSFMFIQRLALETAGSLHIVSDGQDIVELGSPTAPIPEITARRARRYGAALRPDGRGVFVHVKQGHGQVHLLAQPDRERDRPTVVKRHDIPGKVTAARIVGTHLDTTCMRVEKVESTPEIHVDRRALCLDTESGRVLLDEDLPPPGLYGPWSEIAMVGNRMAFIRPGDEGMRVIGWRVPVEAKEVQR